MTGKAQAWADYWREAAATGGGCASGAAGITAACASIWREFGGALPDRPSVLDLATGTGTVLMHLRAVRPGGTFIGVDSAPYLGGVANGNAVTLMPGVAMEQLPFDAARFDAVTSQFGYEYGQTGAVAIEAARVLSSGGTLRLLIHHRSSPVVGQGRVRGELLRWAVAPGSPLGQAENFAAARMVAPLPVPPALRGAPGEAARLFGSQSAAAEIMTGMLQVLELGGANAPALLRQLRGKVMAELARLDALIEAARDEDGIAEIQAEIVRAGLEIVSVSVAREGAAGGWAFAWLVDARRS